MEPRFLIEIVVAVLGTPFAIVMWFLIRKAINDIETIERHFSDFQLYVANNYIHKDDFKQTMDAMFKKLDRIEDFVQNNFLRNKSP